MTPPSLSLSRPRQQPQSETACSYEKAGTEKWLSQFSHSCHLWICDITHHGSHSCSLWVHCTFAFLYFTIYSNLLIFSSKKCIFSHNFHTHTRALIINPGRCHLSYLDDWRCDSWKVDDQPKHGVKGLFVSVFTALLLQWKPTHSALNKLYKVSLNNTNTYL